jgi:hypothetical protein
MRLPEVFTVPGRLARARRGNVAIMFGLTALAVALAAGGGLDLARAYFVSQQLSAAAALTCQYASRPNVVALAFGSGGASSYTADVTSYLGAVWGNEDPAVARTDAAPFAYTQAGAATVTLGATVPTTLMQLAGITSIPAQATRTCFNTITETTPPAPPATASGAMLLQEGFENAAGPTNFNWYTPTGQVQAPREKGQYSNAVVRTPPTTAGYVGVTGTEWLITGYCLEVDTVGVNVTTVPQGSHNAELDCDNGNGTAGDSSISTKTYLAAGTYELRWDYAARISNTYYQTSYICGTTAADTAWANDTSYAGGFGARTNQINVYLDPNTTGSPPTHTTLDGTQTLAGANLIDECVYSDGWIERGVKITVTTAGYYWLSFAADGANDSFGGQIDNIRLCVTACAGTVQDNFPPSWLPAANGGNDAVLFEDTFESPTYSGSPYNTNGDVGSSDGSSYFWGESGHGWSNAPTNQLPYWTAGCPQGNQCVELGWNANSLISRPFLLVPGYYQVSYDFVSEVTFTTATDSYYCGSTPAAAGLPTNNSSAGTDRVTGVVHTSPSAIMHDTNAVGVFMSHAQMASTPNPSTTLGSTTTYTNTTLNADGTVALNADGTPQTTTSTTPTVPPNAINLSNYTVSPTSPLLDICGYANSAQTRKQVVLIQKPAFYWLTFAALGTVDAFGGVIDDVKITALGSPYMASPPSSFVTIPVPNPQVGASISYTGFSVVVQP